MYEYCCEEGIWNEKLNIYINGMGKYKNKLYWDIDKHIKMVNVGYAWRPL